MESVAYPVPSRAKQILRLAALAQDFACGLPLTRFAGSLTPAKRLNLRRQIPTVPVPSLCDSSRHDIVSPDLRPGLSLCCRSAALPVPRGTTQR